MSATSTSGSIWIDGGLVPAADAGVSPLDHGFTVGDGVFESCKVVGGVPFAFGRHLQRLRRSAEVLGVAVPWTDDELRRAADETLATGAIGGDGPDGGPLRLRITITSGVGPGGSARSADQPTLVLFALPIVPRPPTALVATVPWPRNERAATAGVKTTSYAENVVALAEATRRGAQEAIFANTAGDLCEGTGSNVFLADGGRLLTPPLSSGCLAGVTRELLIELVEVEVTPLPLHALAEADEAFLTSTTREVQPIARVDDVELPCCPGPLTTAAAAAFGELAARTSEP